MIKKCNLGTTPGLYYMEPKDPKFSVLHMIFSFTLFFIFTGLYDATQHIACAIGMAVNFTFFVIEVKRLLDKFLYLRI